MKLGGNDISTVKLGASQVQAIYSGTDLVWQNAPVATAATGIGQTSFTANWEAFTDATYYLLDVSTSPTFDDFIYINEQVNAPTTAYVVIGLEPNTTYYYRVRASTGAFPFEFTVKTDNAGTSLDNEFTLPLTTSSGLDCVVEWGDGSSDNITDHTSAAVTHSYGSPGTYTIRITGSLLGWSFLRATGFPGDNQKILDIKQWSGFEVTNDGNFYGCTNLTASATDAPQISTTSLLAFFRDCTNFNGSIGNWDMSGVTSLRNFLNNADAFDRDISNWDINQVTNFADFMTSATGLSTANYDALLVGWESQAPTSGLSVNFGGSRNTVASAAAKQSLIDNYGWTITDGGQIPFEFSVQTDNAGTSSSTSFAMPLTTSTGLDINVDWGDGSPIENITDHTLAIHDYGTAGTYTISVTGSLLGWSFNNGGDKLKILDIKQWSGLNISVGNGFQGCTNLTASATDAPLITSTNLGSYFRSCSNFNGAIGNWDVSNVTNMSYMFFQANLFNANLNNWDTSSLSDSRGLFRGTAFNGDISNWDTSNLLLVAEMFQDTSAFNQNISTKTVNLGQPNEYIAWDTSNVTAMNLMFLGSQAFNQDISNWDVSNVTSFFQCFQSNPVFNQPIGSWNVSNVSNFGNMFFNADAFDQDISNWDINQVNIFANFMTSATGLSTANYDALLVGWEAQAPTYSGAINFGGSQYSSAGYAARQSLIDNYGWTITDGGSTMDVDAVSFFDRVYDAGGELSTTEIEATDTLVQQMKADGIWTKMKAIYPMVGGGDPDPAKAAAACAQNLKSSSFTGTFTTGWTFASTGVTPNGSSAYMLTGLIPSTDTSQDSVSIGVYIRTNDTSLTARIEMGTGSGSSDFQSAIRWDGSLGNLSRINNGYSGGGYIPTKTSGFFTISRTASNSTKKYEDGTLKETVTTTSNTPTAVELIIGARNTITSPLFHDSKENALSYISDGLDDTESSNFYDAVQAFQTTLNREITP